MCSYLGPILDTFIRGFPKSEHLIWTPNKRAPKEDPKITCGNSHSVMECAFGVFSGIQLGKSWRVQTRSRLILVTVGNMSKQASLQDLECMQFALLQLDELKTYCRGLKSYQHFPRSSHSVIYLKHLPQDDIGNHSGPSSTR